MAHGAPEAEDGLAALLAQWRARQQANGADGRLDTLFIHALARHAEARRGPVRAQLHARLAALIAAHDAARAQAPATPATPPSPPASTQARAALGALAALSRHAGPASDPTALPANADRPSPTDEALASLGGPPDLKAMGYFRSTWSRLSAERRLTQSLARVPDQAGPLNAQHLVHQTLAAMHALSPGYLKHFLDYADTLMWLERAQSQQPDEAASRSKAGKPAKGARTARSASARRARPR